MDIFSPTIIDNAIITGSNNASLLQVSSPSATSAFFISGSGNIGIGTTLPLSTLSVAGGNININDGYSIGGNALGSYVPFLRYNNTGAGVPSSSFGHTTAYITSLGGGVFGTNDLIFYAGGLTQTEIVRIVGSTGFVGIGESSPSAKLEIKGSGATSATTALRVENSSAAARLTILDDGTSAFNTSHLYVSGSGNVGIGTATPVHNLVVDGNTGVSINAGGATFPNIHRDSADGGMLLRSWNGSIFTTNVKITPTTEVGIGTTTPTAKLHISGANADAVFRVSSPTTTGLFVSGSGRVGIGTTTPQRELDVNGSVRLGTIFKNGGGNNLSFLSDGSGAITLNIGGAIIGTLYDSTPNFNEIRTSNNQNLSINARGSGSLFLQTVDATRLTITGSNVGIGTTTPTNTLQVVGGITATSITASIISASSGITGSLLGTSSWAQSASNAINAQTASFLPVGTYQITSSWAQSASNAINAQTASFLPVGTYQITSSWAQSASNAINAQTASFLPVGTYQITSSWAVSASNSINARTSSNIFPAITNNTSSYVLTATGNGTINGNSNLTFDGSNLTLGSFTGIVLPSNGYVKGPQNTVLLGGNATYNVSIPNDFVTATASFGSPSSTRIQLLTNVESIPGGYDSGSIFFKTPSGSGMTYTNEGRLGIGISNPTNTLQIQGNVSASSYTGSLFGTSSWATNALTASNITPSITNNTDNRVLTATGGGTINGESNLTFDGSVLTVTGRANISTSITSSTATVGFGLTSALNAGQTTIRGSGVDTVGALTIQNSGGTAVFTVLNGGTTGVGENNPSARLHVKGSGATSATTALRVENSSAAARLTILDDGTSAFNTSHLYVSSSGNVGIGTNLPSADLHISGASVDSLLRVGSPTNSDIFFVNGNGRVGINTTSSMAFFSGSGGFFGSGEGNIAPTLTIFQSSSATGLNAAGLQIVGSGSSAFAAARLNILTMGDKYAYLNIGTSGSGTENNYWEFTKASSTYAHTLYLSNYSNGVFQSNIMALVPGANTSTIGTNNQIFLEGSTGYIGLQTSNTGTQEWIHLYSAPDSGEYIRIDAAQTSNSPPLTAATAKNGYGIVANNNYLAEPDYWMEIKLAANVVLIPCYLPA